MNAARTKAKSADAYRSIGEAAKEIGLPTHVLRFWETKFTALKPVKRPDGRRMFRPQDMEALRAIQVLLHDQGLTIKGAQKMLKEQGVQSVLSGEARVGAPVNIIDAEEFASPAANPVRNLQQTVAEAVESGVFAETAPEQSERLSSLLQELDGVKNRLDAVLVKDAA